METPAATEQPAIAPAAEDTGTETTVADTPAPVVASAPEPAVEEAPAPTAAVETPAEPEAPRAGITAEGRAINDPRVDAKPVTEVAITTNHFPLFSDTVAPAAATSGRIAPRAGNDPRGPLPEVAVAEAAQG